MITKTFIYGLKEKGTDLIRYVGKSNNVKIRFRKHLVESKNLNTHKDCWINSVLSKGGNIEYVIIEEVFFDDWPQKEIYWINKLSKANNLVNHAQGGKGGKPIKYQLSYDQYKIWIKNNIPLSVSSSTIWAKFIKENTLPNNITHYPSDTYKNRGWNGWTDLFNTNNKCYNYNSYLNYEEARKFLKYNYPNIKTISDWKKFKSRGDFPVCLPKKPDAYYSNHQQWRCWKHFLQNPNAKKNILDTNYLNYEDAKKWVLKKYKKNITVEIWRNIAKQKLIPQNIPNKPDRYYKKMGVWKGWCNFLRNEVK